MIDIEKFFVDTANTRFTRKNFLKSLIILGSSLVFLGQTEDALAHPPSDITITYDIAAKTLKAVITHPVNNPESHFIRKVYIRLNGKEIIAHTISRQDNNTSQTVSYLVPDAKAQDRISVEAYCSISGKLEKEIKIMNR